MTVSIGPRLREARLAQGQSLRAVAAAAGISPSLLSQVETGKVEPSVRSLYSIVDVLGVSIDALLDKQALPVAQQRTAHHPVQRFEDNPRIEMENGVTWERLAISGDEGGLEPILATYAPGGASSVDDTHTRHGGVEHGYIIRGALTLKLEFDSFVLRAGDSVCFDSSRPHLYLNHTDEVTQGIWLVSGRSGGSELSPSSAVRSASAALSALKSL
jgi:transcriptional regulator with XRE-family HTH domain